MHVPVIDLSPYLRPGAHAGNDPECARTAQLLDAACREVGFVQIAGHGVPDALTDGLASVLDAFFGLPLETKEHYRREPSANRGYAPPKSESLSASLGIDAPTKDFYESFTVGSEASWYDVPDLPETSYAANTWPEVAGFETAVLAYFAAVREVSRTLLRAFTDALGLPPGHFDAMTSHSIDAMKMNNYALPPGESADGLLGMGAHTDFGILTVLWADRVPGLQILHDGGWHDVQPGPGMLLVNLGDAMARWTGDRWLSTVHRVDPPVVGGTIVRRRSAAFFFDGDHDAVIETLPGCTGAYPPITVAENIAAKVAALKTGAPVGALREGDRVRAAG